MVNREMLEQPRAGFTAAGNPHRTLSGGEAPGATSPRRHQGRQGLGKGPTPVQLVAAIEPAH